MLEWKRGGLTQEILDKHLVLAGGTGDVPVFAGWYNLKEDDLDDPCLGDWEDNEWYCVLPEITVHDPGMDWVDLPQDHVFRKGDEYYDRHYDDWQPAMGVIGKKVEETSSRKGRCRRKDLPPQKRKIVLKKWLIRWEDHYVVEWNTAEPDYGDSVVEIGSEEVEVDA
jgi:hypothetical protein